MPILKTSSAALHYRLTGSGPLLVISQSGEGDADRTDDLLRHLDGYAVLTYDRRGLSRSTLTDDEVTIADHVHDLHHLLAHVAAGPAVMLGCSLGAVIGLHLAVQHPTQLRALVAHEPVAPWLLPEPAAQQHREELSAIRRSHRTGGLAAALPEIVRTLGIDPAAETERDLTPFPMDARRRANFDFFIRRDFVALIDDRLSPDALRNLPTRIIPAVGDTTAADVFDRRCAERLAEVVGRELRVFPGGHNGNTSHPRAYAEELKRVLAEFG